MEDWVGIVVAAGRGVRAGEGLPKQFRLVGGRTLLEWACRSLAAAGVPRIVAVLPPEMLGGPREAEARRIPGVAAVVGGGDRRSRSVRLGLRGAGPSRWALVHDAARPMASRRVVEEVVLATLRHGAAVPVVAVADTLKEEDGSGFVARTVDRARFRLAQTPQGARADWLADALDRAERDGAEVTDEAQALERVGFPVAAVPGDPANRKVTTLADLSEVRRRLEGPAQDLRVGSGFDIHRLGSSRRLVLGGVEFPGRPGLEGHSDADVVVHAAMDALLGAVASGDIGEHFPPEDPAFAGADSLELARHVARLLASSGFAIVNLDLTVLAEAPRIRDRADAMRGAIADALGVDVGRVSVKATTLERLGALGREEGIACHAVALVARGAEPDE